jgi:hypothetical protein
MASSPRGVGARRRIVLKPPPPVQRDAVFHLVRVESSKLREELHPYVCRFGLKHRTMPQYNIRGLAMPVVLIIIMLLMMVMPLMTINHCDGYNN